MEYPTTQETEAPVSQKWSFAPFVIGLFIFLASIGIAMVVSVRIDAANRANLLTRVQTMGYLSDATALESLSGTSADVSSPQYQAVKESLYKLHEINQDSRFIYFMRSNGSKLFFLVDSEKPESADYSPPGQVYEDTSKLEFANYVNEVAFTEGPYIDTWGTWVSAYAPVYAPDSTYVGIIGMDINAKAWKNEILSVSASIIAIGFILGLVLFVIGMYFKRSLSMVRLVEKMNSHLLKDKKHSDDLVARAGLGEWTLIPATGAMSCNQMFCTLMGVADGAQLNLEKFTDTFDLSSKEAFEKALRIATGKNAPEFSCIMTTRTGKRLRVSGTIDYGSGLTPVRVTGIAQEVIGA